MKFTANFKKTLTLATLVFVAGCQTQPKMSTAQIRAMQTRSFEDTTYDNVFRAFKTILQDDGYQIKNQDLSGGLIVATIQKTDGMAGWNSFFSSGQNYRTGEGFEVSVNLEKVGKTVETRLTVQKQEQYSMGGHQGDVILDPGIYKTIYEKVTTEVSRRKAQGKNG